MQVAVWSIGEYADLLVRGEGTPVGGDDVTTPSDSEVRQLPGMGAGMGHEDISQNRFGLNVARARGSVDDASIFSEFRSPTF